MKAACADCLKPRLKFTRPAHLPPSPRSQELQGALDYSVEVRSLLNLVQVSLAVPIHPPSTPGTECARPTSAPPQDRREADVQHCLLALDAVTGALVQVGTSCSLLPTVQQGWPAHGADSPSQVRWPATKLPVALVSVAVAVAPPCCLGGTCAMKIIPNHLSSVTPRKGA